MATLRFRDPQSTKYDFVGEILVTCPSCGAAAHVAPLPGEPLEGWSGLMFAARRLTCPGCGLAKTWNGRGVALSRSSVDQATDPYFDLPLRLQAQTRHGWLWAYNHDHLTQIERYVHATLRERAPWSGSGVKMTMLARLPRWITSAKNRDEILRVIARIRAA